jgi:N-acetylmuramic acid 6-phosphate (MurNAc-6-P) etherase
MPSLKPGTVDRVILNIILSTATVLMVGSCAP